MGEPKSPAFRRKIAGIAKKNEFIRRWTEMGLRGDGSAWDITVPRDKVRAAEGQYDRNPTTYAAAMELKKGNCTEARKLLDIAKNGLPGDDDDYEMQMEPDGDPKVVQQMERALNRVCKKRGG